MSLAHTTLHERLHRLLELHSMLHIARALVACTYHPERLHRLLALHCMLHIARAHCTLHIPPCMSDCIACLIFCVHVAYGSNYVLLFVMAIASSGLCLQPWIALWNLPMVIGYQSKRTRRPIPMTQTKTMKAMSGPAGP